MEKLNPYDLVEICPSLIVMFRSTNVRYIHTCIHNTCPMYEKIFEIYSRKYLQRCLITTSSEKLFFTGATTNYTQAKYKTSTYKIFKSETKCSQKA